MTQANRKVLITGASSGVGLSLARHLSGRFHVLVAARGIDAMKEAFADNPNVTPYQVDLSKPQEVNSTMERIVEEHGFIPCLINNAGINVKSGLQQLTPAQIHESLQVNAISPIMILQRLLPAMVENNFGRVIHITSGAPFNCFPDYGAYSASKAALNAFTVTAARECEGFNIRINLMSPGPVRSRMAPASPMDPSVCHPTVDYLLSLGPDGPTGRFFWLGHEIPLFPDLEGIQWLEGKASERFTKVIP